ncbi:MAG: peptidoglycan-associated lipoprotein Pal [Alphaproteobacteria bacterium]|nr:peptidoglycan-associated lipoprotein Pal [Alphaproteobacteria bacterium]MBL6938339.1 peptidoglycan-associated lipoprotein Pal [Alphaproteobacteria bacterium]MBL7097395.1 peptidoglycan-associated lipoprotein Pal [Alphaproteobacteria bacterium]
MTKFSYVMGLAGLSAALFLGACSTPKPVDTAPPMASTPSAPPSSGSNIVPGSAEDLRVNVGDTVHFAYNEYNIEDSDRATLQRQATWLQKYPSIRVTVEGDCDERGTREYNLALGARRANAVKEYLVSLGVSAARIDTISYGKEHPICTESTEDCWAQNRRGVTSVVSGGNS